MLLDRKNPKELLTKSRCPSGLQRRPKQRIDCVIRAGICLISRLMCLTGLAIATIPSVHAESLTVRVLNAGGGPLKNAVVTANWRGSQPPQPDASPAVMAQNHRRFIPHVLVVPKGSEVAFPNRDTTRHEVYSFSPPKVFRISLYSGQPKQPIRFDKTGIEVLGCFIHDTMKAFIVITAAPVWGKTDARGELRLRGLPDGKVLLRVWHPWMPSQAPRPSRTVNTAAGTVTFRLRLKPPVGRPQGRLSTLQQKFNSLKP